MVKLIRYANEGFVNYDQTQVEVRGKTVADRCIDDNGESPSQLHGCFCFVEEVDTNALKGTVGKRRIEDNRHEIEIPDDTIVWACNIKPVVVDDKLVIQKYDETKPTYAYIKMPVKIVADRVKFIKGRNREVSYDWSQVIYEIK